MSGALAAIVNAIVDGLSPLGLVRLDIPATQNLPRDAEKPRRDRADPSPNPPGPSALASADRSPA